MSSRLRRVGAATMATGVFAVLSMGAVPLANAAPGTGTGPSGQTLTVSQTALPLAGGTVSVSGAGYNVEKGIYLAFCKTPDPGQVPSPCGGGIDMTGASGGSGWISSNPPSYGKDLATPYGPGGTFTSTVAISPKISDTVDCTQVSCAVVTRSDHTRTQDRTQDVVVPVTFSATAPAPGATTPATSASATSGPTSGTTAATTAPTGSVTDNAPTLSSTGAVAPTRAESKSSGSNVAIWIGVAVAVVLGGGLAFWFARRSRHHDGPAAS